MSTKREPLLSGDVIPVKLRSPEEVDAMHEAARAKDAELIQMLLNQGDAMAALIEVAEHSIDDTTRRAHWEAHRASWNMAVSAAAAKGFKPSEQ